MYFHFASVAVLLFLGLFLCGLMLGLGALLRPSNPSPGKVTTYECGEPPSGPAWINFNIRFYLIALVFVIFDVELAFLYPVAAVFKRWVERGQGAFALAEVVVFLAILFLGLVYVWVKGDLEWLKRLPAARPAPAERAPARRAA
ncbi:MAG: NADH-quinone oxidoreductase subunit A [Candidatus Binatia bacterium]